MECAAVPYNTHVVLHGAGHKGSAMVLEYRNVNPFVTFYDSLVYLCALECLGVRNVNLLVG